MSVPRSMRPDVSSVIEAWIGNPHVLFRKYALSGADCGFEFENILDRFDDQDVGTAVDQAANLIEKEIDDLLEAMFPEQWILGGWQESGWANRARDKPGMRWRRIVLRDPLRDLGRDAIDLVGPLSESIFLELDQTSTKVSVSKTSTPTSRNDE